MVTVPLIPALVTNQRPGWLDRSPRQGMSPMKQRVFFDRPPKEGSLGIICHKCIDRNHYSPDCPFPLRSQRRVIQNYEQLTVAEKISVPTTSYHRVSKILGAEDDENKPCHSPNASPAPYLRESEYRDPAYRQRTGRHPERISSGTPRKGDGEIQSHLETDQEN